MCFTDVYRLCLKLWNAKIKVEPLIVLYLFTWSFYLPLYQQYYYSRFGSSLLENTSFPFPNDSQSFCLNDSQIEKYGGHSKSILVQSLSNSLVTYGQLANRLPSILIVLIIGPISDWFGRKPVLLASAIGLVLQAVLAVLITVLKLSPYWFIVANFATGMCGDLTGILAGAFAYVSDVSSKKWRSFRIGFACAMFEVGVALGSFLCGLWLSQSNCNFVHPMWLVLACSIGLVAWILILVRESLSKKDKAEARRKNPRLYTSFVNGLKLFLCKKRVVWIRWTAILILDFVFINAIGNQLIAVFFLKTPPFDVSPVIIGIYQALISVSSGVCATGVIFVMSVVLELPDSFNALLGLIFQCAANVLMGFARTNLQIFFSKYLKCTHAVAIFCSFMCAVAIVQGVQVLCLASLRTILSKLVSAEEQGMFIE